MGLMLTQRYSYGIYYGILASRKNAFVQHYARKKAFAPLAQLAEQVTLNYDRYEEIRPTLPNTLLKFRRTGTHFKCSQWIL